ncbi:LAFE_0H06414g1_1 [Lachancea fermentati]|uniref:Palmitoyltransferase n=1 Tax=Lachancea fermentati TaxID=4955 RepID=A0A1G4MJS5_LACFM|nr:LAFE_0H06414g1_1 [Lachancea fermentati]
MNRWKVTNNWRNFSKMRRNVNHKDKESDCSASPQPLGFSTWLITLEHSDESNKNYGAMPAVTNYIFFMGGRFRTISGTKVLSILVLALVIAPMVLFSIFETRKQWNLGTACRVLVVLFYYFWITCFASFIRTATTDPGVLPRNIHVPTVINDYELPQEYYNIITLPTSDPCERSVDVKYCPTCRIWRPPRASHCSTCETCIMTHDHHCVWVNNCIGQRNYRYFLAFLSSCTITAATCIASCSIHISKVAHASDSPVAILLVIYCGLGFCYPFILLIYHVFLTGTQQTTREYLKTVQSKTAVFHKITSPQNNAFDKKNIFSNMISLICEPRGLSLVSARSRHSKGDWRFLNLPQPHSFQKA